MARAVRSNRLETRTNRLKIEGGNLTFATVGEGLAVGYRRTAKGNGTWQVRLWTGEKYVKHALGEADDFMDADGSRVLSFYQAQDKARTWAEEARKPETPGMKPVTVKVASTRYLEWYKDHRRAYSETLATVGAHILPTWGDTLLMDITTPAIHRWHEKLASEPARKRSRKGAATPAFKEQASTPNAKRARKSTANRILTVLKAVLNRAFRDGLVSDDTPWRRVKPFENADEPVVRFLTTVESIRLVNACREDFRPLVKAALFTGCRYGELARLLVKDVNLDANMIYLTAEAKNGKGRHVPLSAEGYDFFKNAIAGKVGKDHVFTRSDGDPWGKNHHVRLLKAACEQAKIEPEIRFHELRHTYASTLAQLGVDLLTISKLLGHADTRITSRHYAHLCDSTLKNAVAKLPSFGHQPEDKVKSIR
ncbi:MAG: site-specific integrase [Thiobacillaceae bacterium]|jgi:integrase|nr:site-specific integrase [Thiobacillaceae bacterium]